MEVTKKYCDRCGEQVFSYNKSLIEYIFSIDQIDSFGFVGSGFNKGRNDLCQKCYKSFRRWMENKK